MNKAVMAQRQALPQQGLEQVHLHPISSSLQGPSAGEIVMAHLFFIYLRH